MQSIAFGVLWLLVLTLAVCVLRLRNKLFYPAKVDELMFADFGAPLGETFPVTQFESISGEQTNAGNSSGKKTILLITSPSCGACKALYPLISPFIQQHGEKYEFISLMLGEAKEIYPIVGEYNLTVPIVRLVPEDLKTILTDRFPFGYLLSPDGKVISKGLITNEEQFNLLRTWVPKQPKRNRFAFYRERAGA